MARRRSLAAGRGTGLVAAVLAVALAALPSCTRAPRAAEVRVAVAANFVHALEEIAAAFTAATGIEVKASAASTGKLFAQIHHGAPFDVLLAADRERPARALADGLAVPGSEFTYAVGRLALHGRGVDPDDGVATLRRGAFEHLALANPKTAPYGLAAAQVLDALGLRASLEPKLVFGENIGQAMQFVDSGGAELGLVALSQVIGREVGRTWVVPADLHEPIRQDAVLLTAAADRDAARAFLAFLRSAPAHEALRRYGYEPGSG